MNKRFLSWADVQLMTYSLAKCLAEEVPTHQGVVKLYPVPRGGVHVVQTIQLVYDGETHFEFVNDPSLADAFVDDIVDSGTTRQRFAEQYPQPFYSLINKLDNPSPDWIVFPWEDFPHEPQREDMGPTDAIVRLLQYIGEDPDREGLRDTPKRVIKSYGEIFSGYKKDPAEVMTTFEDGACDELVLLKDIEFVSYCEHHMLPFIGKAHIAYVPDGRVIGVSKLARVLEIYAHRLQIQERLTKQVTAALMEHLQPKGAACVIESKHLCMVCRGVQKQNSVMVTSSLEGVFRSDASSRAEFMSMIRG